MTVSGVLGVLLLLVGTVLHKEYGWWAPRVAERVIRAAARLTPGAQRQVRRDEWLGELDQCRMASGGGLLLSLTLVRAGVQLRFRAVRAQLRWLRQPSLRMATWSLRLWVDALVAGLAVVGGLASIAGAITARDVGRLLIAGQYLLYGLVMGWMIYRRRPGGASYASPEQLVRARQVVRVHGRPPWFGKQRRQRYWNGVAHSAANPARR
jgi:hypothetical protein